MDVKVMDKALRKTTQKLRTAPFREDPYTYLVLDHVFPEKIFKEIVRLWPDEGVFDDINKTGRVTAGAYSARQIFMLNDRATLDRLSGEQKDFWYGIAHWMMSEDFTRSILNKILPYLQAEAGDAVNTWRFTPRPQLVVDKGDYALTPHTDANNRAIVMLFYCPKDESLKDQGTSVYAPKKNAMLPDAGPNWGAHMPKDLFELVDTVEFVPNRVLAFVRSNTSYHGVEPMHCDGGRRILSWKLMITK